MHRLQDEGVMQGHSGKRPQRRKAVMHAGVAGAPKAPSWASNSRPLTRVDDV